eukprot:scaffold106726_cov30-Tisochrysis_lutea.AAC.1
MHGAGCGVSMQLPVGWAARRVGSRTMVRGVEDGAAHGARCRVDGKAVRARAARERLLEEDAPEELFKRRVDGDEPRAKRDGACLVVSREAAEALKAVGKGEVRGTWLLGGGRWVAGTACGAQRTVRRARQRRGSCLCQGRDRPRAARSTGVAASEGRARRALEALGSTRERAAAPAQRLPRPRGRRPMWSARAQRRGRRRGVGGVRLRPRERE